MFFYRPAPDEITFLLADGVCVKETCLCLTVCSTEKGKDMCHFVFKKGFFEISYSLNCFQVKVKERESPLVINQSASSH